MRTLCKKALALCVVFALALTCFVGTLSVSAADPIATITVGDVAIDQGTTSVDVILNITAAEPGINEAIISVSSELGTIKTEPDLLSSTATDGGKAILDWDGIADSTGDYSKFFLSAQKAEDATELNGITAAEIKLTFTVAADKAIGEYLINIDTEGVKAADKTEAVITYDYANPGKVTVVAPHVHNVVWTSDKAGNHTSSCDAEGCKDFEAVTEPCADNDADNACDKCGYDMTPAEPECEHHNKTLNSATAAVDANTPGLLDYTCDDCGETEEVDEVVNYHMYYASSYQDFMLENQITERVFIPKRYFTLGSRHEFNPETDEMFLYVDKDFKDKNYSEDKVFDFADAYSESYYNSGKGTYEPSYVWDIYIRSVDMSDAINCAIFVKYDGVWYSAKSYDYCARDYIMDTLETLENTTDTKQIKLRTLLVDLLNYGAAAQTKFAYNTENLANDLLSSAQVAYGTAGDVADLVNQYNNDFNSFTSDYGRVIYLDKTSFDLQSRILANIQFFKGQYTAENTDDLVVKVSFTSANGKFIEKTYVNEKVATEQQLEDGYYYTETADGRYANFQFCELASPDLRQAFSITMFKGDTQVSCIALDSAQSFAFDVVAVGNANDKALANEMIQYSDSADRYFNNK